MRQETLLGRLNAMSETSYAQFSDKLKVSERPILGVRVPHLTALAKELAKAEGTSFLDDFLTYPMACYEEVILAYKTFGLLKLDLPTNARYLTRLLAYNDSWATNDCLCSAFTAPKKNQAAYWPLIKGYLDSSHPWDIRFSTISMMTHYLTEEYTPEVLALLKAVQSEHYYVNMALAWTFATAVAKQRDVTFPYLSKGVLNEDVRKKAIQKCIESYRVSDEDKALLRSMR
ncbi:MAG TPA: DNA alkylation repair protein [Sphaerochaeta sp.]|nr:DNA alkylation repair protein [Sphaerochaeta sp.]